MVVATRKIPVRHTQKLITMRVDNAWNNCPGKTENLLPWRYSKPSWKKPWATWPKTEAVPALSTDLDRRSPEVTSKLTHSMTLWYKREQVQHHLISPLRFSSVLQGYLCCCLKHIPLREHSSISLNLLKCPNAANNCILPLYYVWKVAHCWTWKIKSLAMYILTTRKLGVELMTDETTMDWEKGNELPVASTVLPTFHYLLKSLSSKI